MKKILDVSFDDISENGMDIESLHKDVLVFELHGAQADRIRNDLLPIRIDGYSIVLVMRGEMTISVNYQRHTLHKNQALEFFKHQILEDIEVSPDFKAYHILVSRDFFEGLLVHTNFPNISETSPNRFQWIIPLEHEEMARVKGMLDTLMIYIRITGHQHKTNMVHCALCMLLLEFGDIAHKYRHGQIDEDMPYEYKHKEEIVARFVQLLVNNCQKESEVSFYSTELCITPEYLSRIIKSFSGKPVKTWIKEARLAQAKILLRRPGSSVQQVADELGFSDQSAFGKFFKKISGISPVEYKRSVSRE